MNWWLALWTLLTIPCAVLSVITIMWWGEPIPETRIGWTQLVSALGWWGMPIMIFVLFRKLKIF